MNAPASVYDRLDFPPAPADRPYTFVNMVTTIDGKILTGPRDEHVMDLGSPIDHATMRMIEGCADAVMIGAGSLKATPGLWYPAELKRFVVTGSGAVPTAGRFFTDAPDLAWVVTREGREPDGVQTITTGPDAIDVVEVARRLRQDHGVERLLLEGGSELNASWVAADLVDELFWTIAPKVKLGRDVPTYADGEPLPGRTTLPFHLLSIHKAGEEVYLRYRRTRGGADHA